MDSGSPGVADGRTVAWDPLLFAEFEKFKMAADIQRMAASYLNVDFRYEGSVLGRINVLPTIRNVKI